MKSTTAFICFNYNWIEIRRLRQPRNRSFPPHPKKKSNSKTRKMSIQVFTNKFHAPVIFTSYEQVCSVPGTSISVLNPFIFYRNSLLVLIKFRLWLISLVSTAASGSWTTGSHIGTQGFMPNSRTKFGTQLKVATLVIG